MTPEELAAAVERARPGPDAIAPNACPGGLVFHFYRLDPDGVPVLLMVRRLGPDDQPCDADGDARADARAAADVAEGLPLRIVGYDGDTGARYKFDAWLGLG